MDKVSQENINNLIEKTDIVAVISEYIKVQKKGQNYQAVCPFHKDNNPSLVISPVKKFYKCFSCNESGNALNFVKNFENISFIEAFVKLSRKAGDNVDFLSNYKTKPRYSDDELRLFEINYQASKFFCAILNNEVASDAKSYLLKRGITEKDQIDWEIGFSYKEANLLSHLKQLGYSQQDAINAGIAKVYGTSVMETFVNRIIFPIKNEDNFIIGFSGRSINENSSPKYLNTSETTIFKKSELAFNINNSKQAIKKNDEIIILEGFMDSISLSKIGIENNVAIMGTALSKFHINLFSKFTKNFILFLDGDDPGVNASLKASHQLLSQNLNVKLVLNDSKADPDELIKKNGETFVKKMIENSLHPIDFAIEYFFKKFDVQKQDQFELYIENVKKTFSFIKGELFQNIALQKISNKINIPIENLKNTFGIKTVNNYNVEPKIIKSNQKINYNDLIRYKFAEESIIFYLIHNGDRLEYLEENADKINTIQHKKLMMEIIELYKQNLISKSKPEEIKKILLDKKSKYIPELDNIIAETNYVFLKSLSTGDGLEDSFSILKSRKLEEENREFFKLMSEASNFELKTNFNEVIEKNFAEVIKLRKKREKK
ncbi:DNA primase [Spiroplasma sabaudiense Ar-1343]|uniref:DNA primase n=1 Tax=Spiroplasma sabaudiense Ar-1343 TaxID=1276257 RepID=W6AJ48_9MOLU|nr:DNA primase [Spiroplasma sabaudiense]AHI53734.1 DNA primase [Spiroplasma sabaudiense Ar-1343]